MNETKDDVGSIKRWAGIAVAVLFAFRRRLVLAGSLPLQLYLAGEWKQSSVWLPPRILI